MLFNAFCAFYARFVLFVRIKNIRVKVAYLRFLFFVLFVRVKSFREKK